MADDRRPEQERREPERIRELLGERLDLYRERVRSAFPPEFREHLRVARREFWLAIRSLIDARLESIEEEARRQPRPRGRIDVE